MTGPGLRGWRWIAQAAAVALLPLLWPAAAFPQAEAIGDVVHVPYSGGAPAQLALMSGEVHFTFDNLATAAPNIRAGKLKALAVTTDERSTVLPDLPTMKEAGMEDFMIATWWGLVAPAGTPAETVEKLNAAFVKAMKNPAVQERFQGLLVEATPSTPEEFGKLMADERARYKDIVEAAGAKVD